MLAALVACVLSQESAVAAPTHIVFRESPVVDLFFHVRALAAGGRASTSEAFAPAVAAAQELHRALGGNTLAWGPLAGLLPGCESAADFAAALERVPETLELRGGTKVAMRASAAKLAQALVQAEPGFQELWKEHAERTRAARARWEESVGPKEAELFAFHLASLGMSDPRLAIPVYLVAEAPYPGAVTHLDAQGRGVCFVGMAETEGSQLHETVLHEATHALDVAAGEASVLGQLRARLAAAGLSPMDREMRDVPHTLMFVQAAESVRRTVAPEHQDYGVVSAYYSRVPTAELVRGFWTDHLAGKLTREEALEGMLEGIFAGGKTPPK
jgi:hypothetical protein